MTLMKTLTGCAVTCTTCAGSSCASAPAACNAAAGT
jgi:hypothetical protein